MFHRRCSWRVGAQSGNITRYDQLSIENRSPAAWEAARRRCVTEARRRYRLSEADAQDVAQETLLRAWRSRSTLQDASRFEPWLLAICRREALRHISAHARLPSLELREDDAPSRNDTAAADDRLTLRDVVSRLTPTDKRVLWLRFAEDLDHRQVAQRLGLTENAVRIRTHRLRGRLTNLAPPLEP
jgi:RNA polymerase sigma factor (sigma-70 family)